MKSSPVETLLLCVLVSSVCGCTLLGERVSTVSVTAVSSASPATLEKASLLAKALEYLKAGNEPASRDLFELLADDSALGGVTDEALFRLSILYLREESTKGSSRVQRMLARLKNEFPQSAWTYQAAPLASYLAEVKNLHDQRRELKNLRESNLSLSRDNKELRQSIEKIKNLDLELEKKIKR